MTQPPYGTAQPLDTYVLCEDWLGRLVVEKYRDGGGFNLVSIAPGFAREEFNFGWKEAEALALWIMENKPK